MSTWAAPVAVTGSRAEEFLALTKPRVVLLIALVTAAGFYLGTEGPLRLVALLLTTAGTALAGGGALGLNQLLERDLDARMRRTRGRPLPAGRLGPSEALAFSAALTALGLSFLSLLVHPVAGLVTALTVALYLFAYTPLKRRSAACTLVGAIPGALPPVTGWVAASGEVGAGAWALFGIFFFWQLPHSLAIARLHRDDYARAGMKLLPVVDRDGPATGRHVLLNALALVAASTLPALAGVAGPRYLAAGLALSLGLLVLAAAFFRADSDVAARRLYLGSLAYVPALFLALVLDKV